MALVKGTNSYATVAEADTYFGDRLDSVAWTSADSTTKAQALVTSTSILNDMPWAGTAISEDQALAFPRSVEYFDPRVGSYVLLDGTTTPDRVIKATYELAYHLLTNDNAQDEVGVVKNISVGPISLTDITNAPKVPLSVKRIVRPLLVNAGGSSWWRAN